MPRSPLDPEDPRVRSAVFGQQVEDFLASPVGMYLCQRAENERERALQALTTVHPWRRNRIRDLQNQVWRADSVSQWLADAVTDGRMAREDLGIDE